MRGFRRPVPTGDSESGFTLLEVIIAMAVFTVFASISLGLFVNLTDVVGDNIRRTAASNLVNSQLQTARSQLAQDIADGQQITYRTVGGNTFKVTQTAVYVASNASTSICSGSGNSLAYKLVTVSVSWPNMGSVKPVRGDTLRAVGVGDDGLDATKGTVAVAVTGSTGQSVSGVDIVLTPGNITRTTGDDGCAIFTNLTPGSYTATANTIGYVGSSSTRSAFAASLAATAGDIRRGTLLYDTERTLNITFDSPVGAIVPANLALRMGNTYTPEATMTTCTSSSTSACISGVPGIASHLFPESWTIKAGTCTEASPSQIGADLRPASADNSTAIVPVGAATVRVVLTASPTIGIAGRTITFTHLPAAGCLGGETYTMPSVAAGSTMALPYGTWTVSAPILNVSGVPVGVNSQTITLSPTAKTSTTVLQVAL